MPAPLRAPAVLALFSVVALASCAPPPAELEPVQPDCAAAHDGAGPFLKVPSPAFQWSEAGPSDDHWSGFFGGGLSIADFDGDGLPDLYVTNRGDSPTLLRNLGGFEFEPVPGAGGADPGPGTNGSSAADIDSDGDIDLVVMSDGDDRLYSNAGDGTFTDTTDEAGFSVPERTLAVAWADLNGDRQLDPFFCTFFGAWSASYKEAAPDHLYLSDPGGAYVERNDLVPGADQPSGCFAARFAHVNDGDAIDLVTVHDKGQDFAPDRAFMDWDGGFVERGAALGLDQRHSGMGLAVGDLDNDGAWDLWKATTPQDLVLRGLPGSAFVDDSQASGLAPSAYHEGATWDVDTWDIDDDGDLDALVMLSAYGATADAALDDHLWLNQGDGTFSFDTADALGLDGAAVTRSFARADLDGDGAEDLVLPEIGGGLAVYAGRCSGQGFVDVHVQGTHCARQAPGTRVRAWVDGREQVRQVTLGGEVQSSQPPSLRFGLGGAEQVERLEVTFPCGAVVELHDVAANTRVRVVEPEDG